MMHASSAVTMRTLENGEYTGDTDHHCARGLESRLSICAHRRRAREFDCLNAVLDEQQRQWYKQVTSAVALASVYTIAIGTSRQEASERGKLDAEEASRIEAGKESLTTLIFKGNKGQAISLPKEGRPGRGIRNIFRKRERK